jgi:hypothetical protein
MSLKRWMYAAHRRLARPKSTQFLSKTETTFLYPCQDIRDPLLQVLSPHHPERLDPARERPGLPFGVLRLRLLHAAALNRRGIRAGGGSRPLQVSLPRYAASSRSRANAPDHFFSFSAWMQFFEKYTKFHLLYIAKKCVKFCCKLNCAVLVRSRKHVVRWSRHHRNYRGRQRQLHRRRLLRVRGAEQEAEIQKKQNDLHRRADSHLAGISY